jgi:hypothetical protein
MGRRLQVLDELVPGKRTVAVLMNPDTPFSALALRELKAAAAETAQPIQVFEARSADQVLAGVEAAAKLAQPVYSRWKSGHWLTEEVRNETLAEIKGLSRARPRREPRPVQ